MALGQKRRALCSLLCFCRQREYDALALRQDPHDKPTRLLALHLHHIPPLSNPAPPITRYVATGAKESSPRSFHSSSSLSVQFHVKIFHGSQFPSESDTRGEFLDNCRNLNGGIYFRGPGPVPVRILETSNRYSNVNCVCYDL